MPPKTTPTTQHYVGAITTLLKRQLAYTLATQRRPNFNPKVKRIVVLAREINNGTLARDILRGKLDVQELPAFFRDRLRT